VALALALALALQHGVLARHVSTSPWQACGALDRCADCSDVDGAPVCTC
jgi:hypothetical protein